MSSLNLASRRPRGRRRSRGGNADPAEYTVPSGSTKCQEPSLASSGIPASRRPPSGDWIDRYANDWWRSHFTTQPSDQRQNPQSAS